MKRKVLIMAGYYLPSIKGGGPIQSIKNLVDTLSEKIEFYIVAADRDLGDFGPFENIEIDKWINSGKAKVFYTDTSKLTFKKTADVINSVEYDALYLNSFFDYKSSIIPMLLRKFNKIQNKTLILAPRGQFSPGAMGLKSVKKNLFIKITKLIGLHNGVKWHATAEAEKRNIERIYKNKANIIVANNLTANYDNLKFDKELNKTAGELKIIFLSRIHPKKNLKKAIEFLKTIKGNVEFNIYGPIEDEAYWLECKTVIHTLAPNIKVDYKGIIEHDKVLDVFKQHHVFLFPTLGENFGHVISEALVGGCAVIISDQTPWRGLNEIGVGYDIALDKEKGYMEALQYYVDLDGESYRLIAQNAFEYGKAISNNKADIKNYCKLFF